MTFSTRLEVVFRTALVPALFLMALSFSPISVSSQITDSGARMTLAKGTLEQKRDLLAAIRTAGDEQSAELAILAFADKNAIVRASAIEAARRARPSVLLPALKPLLKDGSLTVRKEAAKALGNSDDSDAQPLLIERLTREKDREVRAAIISALGRVGSIDDFPRLLAYLRKKPSESNEFERAMATRAMGQIARRSHGLMVADTIPSSFNRISSIADINFDSSFEGMSDFAMLETQIITMLESSEESMAVRRECAFLLGEAGGFRSVSTLKSHVEDEDPYLARIALEALVRLSERSNTKRR
jgi:HEAT repeat protein